MGQSENFEIIYGLDFKVRGTYTIIPDYINNRFSISLTNQSITNISASPIGAGSGVGSVDCIFKKINGNIVYIRDINNNVFWDNTITLTKDLPSGGTLNLPDITSSQYSLNNDGTLGEDDIYLGNVNLDIGKIKISNGHFKVDNNWKNAIAWLKVSGIWKRCIMWKKINGIWKKGD